MEIELCGLLFGKDFFGLGGLFRPTPIKFVQVLNKFIDIKVLFIRKRFFGQDGVHFSVPGGVLLGWLKDLGFLCGNSYLYVYYLVDRLRLVGTPGRVVWQ